MGVFDFLIGNKVVNSVCLLSVFFVCIYNYNYLYSKENKGTGYFVLWLVFTLYSSLYSPSNGDNFTSLETYMSYQSGVEEKFLHFEPIYFRTMDLIPYGYVAWRFVLWGIGSLLLVLYSKWMKFDAHVATISLLCFSLSLLYYQRAIIGYMLLYVALSMILKSREENKMLMHKIGYMIIAGTCFLSALSFHTTMIVYVILVLLSSFIKPTKYVVVMFFITCLILVVAADNLTEWFLDNVAEETQNTAERYISSGKIGLSSNFFGIISWLISYTPFYVMLIFCLWNVDSIYMGFNRYEKAVLLNTVMLVAIAVIYARVSSIIQGKFYIASMLPWGLFLSSYYTRCKENKVARLFVKASLVSFVLGLAISVMTGSIIAKIE